MEAATIDQNPAEPVPAVKRLVNPVTVTKPEVASTPAPTQNATSQTAQAPVVQSTSNSVQNTAPQTQTVQAPAPKTTVS